MSDLTDEFRGVVAELAAELGEGLTASLLKFPPTATYDPAEQEFSDGGPIEQTFACTPPSTPRGFSPALNEVVLGNLTMLVPALDQDGAELLPVAGDRISFAGSIYQIVRVAEVRAGDGIVAFQCEVKS